MGLYKGTCVAGEYAIPPYLQGPDQHSNLVNMFRRAVRRTVHSHPLCQVSLLKPRSKTPSWGKIDKIEIGRLITWRTLEPSENYEGIRKQILKTQLDTEFDAVDTQQGWRITVLRESPTSSLFEAFFVFNHTHFDGMSGKIFHEDLLASLNYESELFRNSGMPFCTSMARIDRTGGPLALPPPLEDMALFLTSNLWMASYLWKKFRPAMFRKATPPEWSTVWPRINMELPYETGIVTLIIPRDIVESVVTVCRHKGNVTITSLLHVLTAVSLARQIPESEMPAIKSVTTIDLRRHMPNPLPGPGNMDPKKTMANIVGRLTHRFDNPLLSMIRGYPSLVQDDASTFVPSSTSSQPETDGSSPQPSPKRKRGGEPLCDELTEIIWEKAAEVRGEIEHKLDMGLKNDELSMMKFADDWRGHVRATLGRPRAATFLVSNLVVLDGEPPAPAPAPVLAPPRSPSPTPTPLSHHLPSGSRPCIRHGNLNSNALALREQFIRNIFPPLNLPGPSRSVDLYPVTTEEQQQQEQAKWEAEQEEREQRFAIKRASFSLSAHVNGAGIQIGVVSVKGGDMALDLTWHKGIVDDGVMETLGEDLQGWLRGIAKAKGVDRRYHYF